MKVIGLSDVKTRVECPKGGFISNRFLLDSDGVGFTITKTVVPVNGIQIWHYTNHVEACYCVSGKGVLTELSTGKVHQIAKDVLYVIDNHDRHSFEAIEETVLICFFVPALKGFEVHDENGSYKL